MISTALLVLAMAPAAADRIFATGFDDPLGCPAGRQVSANIAFDLGCVVNGVNVREWSNIWGYECGTGDTVPFPGITGSANGDPTILNFGRQTYIAAHFHVPEDLQPNTYGWITHTEYDYGADLTAAISTNCGDFDPANARCLTVTVSGQLLVPWRVGSGNFCPLVPGQDYFFNVKFTDPSQATPTCAANAPTCAVSLPNNVHVP